MVRVNLSVLASASSRDPLHGGACGPAVLVAFLDSPSVATSQSEMSRTNLIGFLAIADLPTNCMGKYDPTAWEKSEKVSDYV